jgi:nucleotide-binding universal stress UspA family protein
MKYVLVLLHDDAGLPSRIQVALDMVRCLDGQLFCLDLKMPLLAIGDDPLFGALLLEDVDSPAVDTDARATIERSGVPFRWIERRGDLGPEVAQGAEGADVVVLGSPRDSSWAVRGAVGRLLVKSGKPVVTVPAGTQGLKLDGHVALLWDGSQQAQHALTAAMPLLKHASRVTIVEVDDGSLRTPAAHVANFLQHQGIENRIQAVSAGGEKAAYPIMEQVRLLDPGYVVMGGFGHPRLIEQLFGGVTEHLLAECPVPLFLKH